MYGGFVMMRGVCWFMVLRSLLLPNSQGSAASGELLVQFLKLWTCAPKLAVLQTSLISLHWSEEVSSCHQMGYIPCSSASTCCLKNSSAYQHWLGWDHQCHPSFLVGIHQPVKTKIASEINYYYYFPYWKSKYKISIQQYNIL